MSWVHKVPDELIGRANSVRVQANRVVKLDRWCRNRGLPALTLMQLEDERKRRGLE